jgi:hypothetical protein
MDPVYELLVRYVSGVDPVRVASALLDDWGRSDRPPLLVFSKKHVGVEPSVSALRERLIFSPSREDCSLRLRTRTGRGGGCRGHVFHEPHLGVQQARQLLFGLVHGRQNQPS